MPTSATDPAMSPAAAARLARVAGDAELARAVPHTIGEHVKAVGMGLSTLFVPISLLQATGQVRVAGGHGLLPITDVDTLFLDLSVVAVMVLLWKRRHMVGDRLPVVVFGLLLACATAVLLGYVVTNYGTLWRMRTLVMIPLWFTMVALSPSPRRADARTVIGTGTRAVP
jgi:hypothetical protein